MDQLRSILKEKLDILSAEAKKINTEFIWKFDNYKDTNSDCYFKIGDRVYLLYFLIGNSRDESFSIKTKNKNIVKNPSGEYYTKGKSNWLAPNSLAVKIKSKMNGEKFGIIFYSNKDVYYEGFKEQYISLMGFNITDKRFVNYYKQTLINTKKD